VNKSLTRSEIENYASHYLNQGRNRDRWEISEVNINIEDKHLTARVRMTETYVSATDSAGFHLTIFTILEFLSQLSIIYGHVWAGHTEKTSEGWLLETSVRTRKAIRDSENICVEMDALSIRKVGENIIGKNRCRVFDDQGGLFEAELKCFLS